MKKSARIPKSLSAEARKLWRDIVTVYELDDPAGVAILQQACEALDRLREAQQVLSREGITVSDRFQQPKQHPATMIERDARTALFRALKALNLDVEPPLAVGRPGRY